MKYYSGVPTSSLYLMPDDTPITMIDTLTAATVERLEEKGILTFGDLRKALAPERKTRESKLAL